MRSAWGAGAAAITCLMWACQPAGAATLTSGGSSLPLLIYTAGAGVANHLTVTDTSSTTTFADTAETITVSGVSGCTGSGTHSVTCPSALGVFLDTGDLADQVSVSRLHAFPSVATTYIEGGAGDDVLTGGTESDVFMSTDNDGADAITGGGGTVDTVDYSQKTTAITAHLDQAGGGNGAAGENDTFDASIDGVVGGPGADTITGGDPVDHIDGRGGADTISAGAGDDVIDAVSTGITDIGVNAVGNDMAADTVDAGPGNDTIYVGGGDVVHAGDGNDTVSVKLDNATNETIYGEGGDDVITPGLGDDVVDGGDGNDVITGDAGATATRSDNDTFSGGAGDDVIRGLSGNDVLDGGPGSDDLEGGDGNDTITGGAGTDTIDAGVGADVIHATDGERDSISCGGGADTLDGDLIDAVAADCETIGGAAQPLSGSGSQPGAPGPPGPAGASAPPAAFVLVAVDRRLSGRRGHRVRLRYVSTLDGAVTLVVKQGSKTIATITGTARAGLDTIVWNGKHGSKKAARGTYTLSLDVVSLDGRRRTATSAVRLR